MPHQLIDMTCHRCLIEDEQLKTKILSYRRLIEYYLIEQTRNKEHTIIYHQIVRINLAVSSSMHMFHQL